MGFNFKDVKVPAESLSYVRPEFWTLAPVRAELVRKEGGNDHLAITFEGGAGKLIDKFWLTEKAIVRLQYLHKGLYDKDLDKDFKTSEEIATYFNTLFSKKNVPLNLIVGGNRSENGKVYASLSFLKFITNDPGFEEGAFEEGSARWKDVVTEKEGFKAPASNSPIVDESNDEDKMPWD